MRAWKTIAALACLVGCGDPQGTYNYVLTLMGGQTVTKDPWAVAAEYRDAHQAAASIIDLHADTLLLPDEDNTPYERLLTNPDRDGHVDVPRMIQGNVALQVFSAGVKASLDTLGDSAPSITGKYVAPNGTQYSRYGYERDPNVPAYDDPNDPYAGDYAGAPLFMPREVGTYVFRLSGRPCKTWYDGGNWEASLFGNTPPCPEFNADRMYLERYLSLATRLRGAVAAAPSKLRLITTRAQLDALIAARVSNKNVVGALLSTEGLYFRSDASTAAGRTKLLANFNELHGAGYRMFALTHFMDNDHGGSSTGMARATLGDSGRGLTAAGQLLAEQALTRGATLDVAHASRTTLSALAAYARSKQKPLVFSHGGIMGIPGTEGGDCWNPRNIEAPQLREIASTGGVVGIGFAEEFVCDTDPSAWAKAVRYAVDAIDNGAVRLYGTGVVVRGVDSVGLGSDYDGGIEAYTDIANLEQYTRALMCKKTLLTPSCLERPFTVAEVHKILGGNSLRVLRANLN
jgi:microsomal dipeptidase-like Zn-dependent dipeptidase